MQLGQLTVTGNNSTRIALVGRPREVLVRFKEQDHDHDHGHVPCNPHHHHDTLEYQIVSVDEDMKRHREPGHCHHDREFFLFIEWQVSGVCEIEWIVIE